MVAHLEAPWWTRACRATGSFHQGQGLINTFMIVSILPERAGNCLEQLRICNASPWKQTRKSLQPGDTRWVSVNVVFWTTRSRGAKDKIRREEIFSTRCMSAVYALSCVGGMALKMGRSPSSSTARWGLTAVSHANSVCITVAAFSGLWVGEPCHNWAACSPKVVGFLVTAPCSGSKLKLFAVFTGHAPGSLSPFGRQR